MMAEFKPHDAPFGWPTTQEAKARYGLYRERPREPAPKPILCLDFDGVLHSYTSGWQGAEVIPDPMTEGAAEFLAAAVEVFRVAIFSSRSNQPLGIDAMKLWLRSQLYKRLDHAEADELFGKIEWPLEKPPALVTLDDRAVQFTGAWPDVAELRAFRTWQQEARDSSAPDAIQRTADDARLRFEGDLDRWMKTLGAGISGYQPEAYAVMDAACAELVALRARNQEPTDAA